MCFFSWENIHRDKTRPSHLCVSFTGKIHVRSICTVTCTFFSLLEMCKSPSWNAQVHHHHRPSSPPPFTHLHWSNRKTTHTIRLVLTCTFRCTLKKRHVTPPIIIQFSRVYYSSIKKKGKGKQQVFLFDEGKANKMKLKLVDERWWKKPQHTTKLCCSVIFLCVQILEQRLNLSRS